MIKSPLNYIGGKYRLLPQLMPLFPKQANIFIDLFAGGLDVSLNVSYGSIIANDINNYVIDLYRYFQQHSIDEILYEMHTIIEEYKLSKQNQKGYLELRNAYNESHAPMLLFALICYGFNHQLRFNNNGDFNNPFGRNRSCYNQHTEKNLKQMHSRLLNIELYSYNFHDFPYTDIGHGVFLYADPPYLITRGSYNDGKRGFEGWTASDDASLFHMLDTINQQGGMFALSNVILHKGIRNRELEEWSERYHRHFINVSYDNSNYQSTHSETIEVLITNY